MDTATLPDRVTLAPGDLARLHALYAQGQCLQAYRLGESFGPLHQWVGAPALLIAGRIGANLGAARFCQWAHLKAFRSAPDDPEASYYFARALFERRGPLACWRFLRTRGELDGAPVSLRADWLAFHGSVLGRLRDFDAAENWLSRAETLAPQQPWPWIERCAILELEDRNEESLAAARHSLELRPWYRPGVQAVAHVLELLGRDHQALDLLKEGADHLESTLILHQLASLQTELGHHTDARRTYDRYAELAVLVDKDGADWLAARRSDAAYFCGDLAAATELARQVKGPLYAHFAESLSREPFEERRVLLDVGFVRQHHQTCVPATLASLSRYWKRPAEHLDVAGAICYDGTPDHRERAWAQEHGYVCREFTITWEAAVALIDRGVPFTLTLVDPSNAHMQAVIGYDTCRKSLLARDPYIRQHIEYHADGLLQSYRSTGPRGHAVVPLEETHRLDGLTLPDADLYDRLHRLQRALERHDRAASAAEYDALRAAASDHRLTWHARRSLALYDADPAELLACAEGLLKLFPDDQLCLLLKLSCLRDQARRDDLIAALDAACARRDADPVFRRLRAREALADAREHPRAIRLIQRTIRFQPGDPGNFVTLAHLFWGQRRFEEAVELYGFAACLGDKDEGLARDYFAAAQHLRRAGETLRFLRRRFERFGAKSSQPARTLYWALQAADCTHEALAVLEEALRLRPDDGEMLLFAAGCRAEHGDFPRAAEKLAAAEGRCPRVAWLRVSAGIAGLRGDLAAALALWRQVADAEPTAPDASAAVARHLAELEGRPAARAFLRAACDRFRHNFPLHQLLSAWLREQGPQAQEPVIRRIIAIHPADAWARRELAVVLTEQGRLAEAEAELEESSRLEPASPSYWCCLGGLRERQGRLAEARETYRNAIRLSVDSDYAINRLMQTADNLAERREALALVAAELRRQVIFGDGLLAFQQHARWTLAPEELLAALREAHAARPDLWHAWSALIVQLGHMGQYDEAHALAVQATERFPLLPGLWLDLGQTCRAREDTEGELAALKKAIEIRPSWAEPVRRLGEAHLRADRPDEAQPLLERAVALAPLDPVSHATLADALWKRNQKEAALDEVRIALQLDVGFDWAWSALRRWSAELERTAEVDAFARELTDIRSTDWRAWLKLAEVLSRPEDRDERLAALDRALTLDPHIQDSYDLKSVLLAEAERFDEAEAVCRAPAWSGNPPLLLRGRLAWLKARRGDLPGAIASMRAALAEDPDYHWGWTQMADWLREHGTPEELREAGDNLVRITPRLALGYSYRGEGRFRGGDREGAKDDFRRAFEMDPNYYLAGMYLFDIQLTDGELEPAAATLAELKKLGDDSLIRAREVMLAAKRGDRSTALKLLREVLRMPAESNGLIDVAVRSITEAGWSADLIEPLDEVMGEENVRPVVARHWVSANTGAGNWDCARRFDELLGRGEIGHQALEAYAHALGLHRQAGRLSEWIERYREPLRSHTRCWGTIGYALAQVENYAAVCDWLADWPSRDGVESWMLTNLALGLRGTGRHTEGNAISRYVVDKWPGGAVTDQRVWLAFDEALAGRAVEELQSLVGVKDDQLDPAHRFVRALIAALAEVQGAASGKKAAFAAARRRLAEAAKACSPLTDDAPVVQEAYRVAIARLARDAGGVRAKLWQAWRRRRPLLPTRGTS